MFLKEQKMPTKTFCRVKTCVVISDKGFLERDVFHTEFPITSVLLCLLHVLTSFSFRREVTCDKLGLLSGERDHALELITKLVYSKQEVEYNGHYEDLLKILDDSETQLWQPTKSIVSSEAAGNLPEDARNTLGDYLTSYVFEYIRT